MDDIISRKAAIAELDHAAWGKDYDKALAKAMLESLPTAQPKKGKWIAHPGGKFVGFPYMHYECDQCRDFEPEERNFCPNCGADMRGKQDG